MPSIAQSFNPIVDSQTTVIWECLPGEPILWYDRFSEYLRIGPSRSISKLMDILRESNSEIPSIPSVYDTAKKWNWAQRAKAWDLHLIKQDISEVENEVQRARKKRRQLLDTFFDKIILGMQSLDYDDLTWKNIAAVINVFNNQSRMEYERIDDESDITTSEQTASELLLSKISSIAERRE